VASAQKRGATWYAKYRDAHRDLLETEEGLTEAQKERLIEIEARYILNELLLGPGDGNYTITPVNAGSRRKPVTWAREHSGHSFEEEVGNDELRLRAHQRWCQRSIHISRSRVMNER
jgi:hypothetical protein